MAEVEDVKAKLEAEGYIVVEEGRGQHCHFMKLQSGQRVNVFDTGKVQVQGKNPESVQAVLEGDDAGAPSGQSGSRKVFVVYGHDSQARTQLEAILRRWRLDPVVLDQLTSEGDTLIEKLERYSADVNYAIVLATPDDEGYPTGQETAKKFRARQNVVLELGMMLQHLGRKRVAILMPSGGASDMERPSDIAGLIYISYRDNIEDAKVTLFKEMLAQGLRIDPTLL